MSLKLAAGGTRISAPVRLTEDEADDVPGSWTADSRAVLFTSNRNRKWGVFKQAVDQGTAQPLVSGQEAIYTPVLSPDGLSALYIDVTRTDTGDFATYRLMRVPVDGGMPKLVLKTRQNWVTFDRAVAPAPICAILELSDDEKLLRLSSFDPLHGDKMLLRTLENDPASSNSARPACWQLVGALSPDGSTFALAREDNLAFISVCFPLRARVSARSPFEIGRTSRAFNGRRMEKRCTVALSPRREALSCEWT